MELGISRLRLLGLGGPSRVEEVPERAPEHGNDLELIEDQHRHAGLIVGDERRQDVHIPDRQAVELWRVTGDRGEIGYRGGTQKNSPGPIARGHAGWVDVRDAHRVRARDRFERAMNNAWDCADRTEQLPRRSGRSVHERQEHVFGTDSLATARRGVAGSTRPSRPAVRVDGRRSNGLPLSPRNSSRPQFACTIHVLILPKQQRGAGGRRSLGRARRRRPMRRVRGSHRRSHEQTDRVLRTVRGHRERDGARHAGSRRVVGGASTRSSSNSCGGINGDPDALTMTSQELLTLDVTMTRLRRVWAPPPPRAPRRCPTARAASSYPRCSSSRPALAATPRAPPR